MATKKIVGVQVQDDQTTVDYNSLQELFRITEWRLRKKQLWKVLGLFLGIEKPTLDSIEYDCFRNLDECLMEMLNCWLKNGPKNPKEMLDSALKETQKNTCSERKLRNNIKQPFL